METKSPTKKGVEPTNPMTTNPSLGYPENTKVKPLLQPSKLSVEQRLATNVKNTMSPTQKRKVSSDGNTSSGKKSELDSLTNSNLNSFVESVHNMAVSTPKELPNLTEKELAENVDRVHLECSDGSYAGAVKQTKLDVPYLVYFQKSIERREPVTRAQYEALITKLLNDLMDKVNVETAFNVNIDWHGFGLGRGLIACADQSTADQIKNFISNFKIGETQFRGWLKDEFGDRIIGKGFLSGKPWADRNAVDAMKWIFKLNKIQEPKFQLVAWTATKGKDNIVNGVHVRFECKDENLATQICKIQNESKKGLKAGLCRFYVTLKKVTGDGNKHSGKADEASKGEAMETGGASKVIT